jgi:hypothetical protein
MSRNVLRKYPLITWMLLLPIFLYGALVFSPSTAYGCSCAQPAGVKDEFDRSKAVFTGEVISVKEKQPLAGYVSKKVIFEVNQSWKGIEQSQIQITTGQGDGDCGIDFVLGEDYLVYASDSDLYGENQLTTIICDRTSPIVSAKEDLTYLGDGKVPVTEVDLLNDQKNGILPISMILVGITVIVGLLFWKFYRNKR